MKRKDWARSPPTTRNIPELGIWESIPLTEYFPFLEVSPRIRVGLNGKTLFVKKVTEILRD